MKLQNKLQNAGLLLQGEPIADGQIHRCGTRNKPRSKNGWYVISNDGKFAAFGNWETGDSHETWGEFDKSLWQDVENKRNQEREDAANIAFEFYENAARTGYCDYLVKKKISAHGARFDGNALVIPLQDSDGKIWSYQKIYADGKYKPFLTGGRTKGCYYIIGIPKAEEKVIVCEGFATGASIYEATGLPVVVAFYASNLKPVADSLPFRNIVIAADNDKSTVGESYAKSSGYPYVMPKNGGEDFSDLFMLGDDIKSYFIESKKSVSGAVVVHGLVGEIADWMTRTAWKPQPLLSLSAALVFVGFLKGRKYITETNIYSNVYAFNIAGTACGKDRPQVAIKFLMSLINMQDKVLHAPASGAGFIDSLYASEGHGISAIDEMGDYIDNASNKNSGSHQKKVFKYWLEAFTSTTSYIDGERRADAAKEKAKRVESPLYCLLGSTNPISLKSALTGESIGNGLLNRFLFFSSFDSPRKRKSRDFDLHEKPSESMLNKMREYLHGTTDQYGNLKTPTIIKFSDEAMDLYDSIDDFYEDECAKLDINNRLRFLYGRAHEYVGKLALILCDDKEITKQDVQCAHDIVSLSVKNAISFCGDIAETREEKNFLKVGELLKNAKSITMSEFVRITQFMKKQERIDCLNTYEDLGKIAQVKKDGKTKSVTIINWI